MLIVDACVPPLGVHVGLGGGYQDNLAFWNEPLVDLHALTLGTTYDKSRYSKTKCFGVDALKKIVLRELLNVECGLAGSVFVHALFYFKTDSGK